MTKQDLAKMRVLALKLSLQGRELLFNNDDDLIISVCNGIGPEWFPKLLRKAIDKLHPSLAVVAAIHDLRYYFGTGTNEDFNSANAEFLSNGILVANYFYHWYDIRRYLARHSAYRFYALCDMGGKVAYDKARRDRLDSQR